jgi:hypothetical protein
VRSYPKTTSRCTARAEKQQTTVPSHKSETSYRQSLPTLRCYLHQDPPSSITSSIRWETRHISLCFPRSLSHSITTIVQYDVKAASPSTGIPPTNLLCRAQGYASESLSVRTFKWSKLRLRRPAPRMPSDRLRRLPRSWCSVGDAGMLGAQLTTSMRP